MVLEVLEEFITDSLLLSDPFQLCFFVEEESVSEAGGKADRG